MKIGIAGYKGRMGQHLQALLEGDHTPPLSYGGGSDRKTDLNVFIPSIEGLIDFTTPESTMQHLTHALNAKIPVVIGTTGLTENEEQQIYETANHIPVIYAANTSIGVNLISALIEKAARLLEADTFDIEINETHHRHKVDAPSGTALMLGHAAAKGRDVVLDNVRVDTRSGHTGARKTGDIGFSVQRGGAVPGEHVVTFFGDDEHVTIAHQSNDRALFAKGALKAMYWLRDKPPGLYSMKDVLGL